MIGRHGRSGKNAFFVTGSSRSNLLSIMQKNLEGDEIKAEGDGWDGKDLFFRSDNVSFYYKGIVAHSIMCSDDTDPCYHDVCDDVAGIDFPNMINIVRAIVKATKTLVNGEDTPKK